MYRKLLKIALLTAIFAVFTSVASYAVPFPVNCNVYISTGASGDATSPNSYGRAFMYRPSIANESGTTILYPNANYSYYPADGSYPAYYDVDMGTVFSTPRAIGQIVRGVVEVYPGLNGYSGTVSYVGATAEPITSLARIDLHKVSIQPMPTPRFKSKTESTIVISWEGVTTSDATSNIVNSVETYAVYYSTSSSGPFTFEGTASHVSGEVTYTHSGLSSANTYYYKLKMRYTWPGNTPAYYDTTAVSVTSEGIRPLAPGPVVSSINPSVTQNSGAKTFLISGNYFTDANGASFRRTGFTAVTTTSVTVVSDTTLLATIEFNPGVQAIGTWDVRVSNPTTYGTGSNLLTLTAEAPYITSVEPISARTGDTVSSFKVYGNRLYPGSTVKLSKTGYSTINATSVTTSSGYTLLTSSLPLTNATIGTWDAVVTSMFGQVTSEPYFTVTSDAPTLTSITPTRGATNSTVTITSLAGTNLFDGALVELRKPGQNPITAESISSNTGHTSLTGTFNLTGATTGAWSVFVRNTDTKVVTGESFFTVISAPVVSSITPATKENNASVAVTIRGANFFSTPEVSLSKTGMTTIDATGEVLVSSTEITCTLPITNVTIGTRDVVVANADGTGILSNGFTITSEAPTFTSITPNSGAGGYTIPVTISGNKFYANAIVELRKTDRTTVTATSVTVSNINTITCSLALPNGILDIGTWDVYVRNTDNKSTIEAGAFTISYGSIEAPSNCAIAPLSPTSVSISWTDNSGNEESFHIERSSDGSAYTEIGTTAAGVVTYTGSGTTGLSINTRYWFRVRAYGGGSYTSYSTASPKYTLAAVPAAAAFGDVNSTVINVNWTANSNPAGTLYFAENTSNSNNSGNTAEVTWRNTGLDPVTTYSYRVKALNNDGVSSDWVSLGNRATSDKYGVYDIKANDIKLLSGDIISSTSKISTVFSSETGIAISSFRLYIDGRAVTDGTNTYYDDYSTDGVFTTVNYTIKTALGEGTYVVKPSATDPSGVLFEDERSGLKVMAAGTKAVIGYALPYPNPYDPTKGSVRITYNLATDTNVTMYVFDVNGRIVWKQIYMSGINGGKAGYNEVLWNGYDNFNRILDNDVYLIRIVESGTGKVMGKTKLVVVKTISMKENKEDNRQNLFAAFLGGDGGGNSGTKNALDFGKILLFSVAGLVAFEELIRMYSTIKNIKRFRK